MRSLKGKHIFSFHTNQWETRSALFVRFYRAAGIDGYGLWNAKHVQEKERQRWRRLQSWLQCGRVQQSAEGGESRQQEPAPLHELRPHRDGWDGLLLGALSRLRQVGGWDNFKNNLHSCRIPPGRRKKHQERLKKLMGRKNSAKRPSRPSIQAS